MNERLTIQNLTDLLAAKHGMSRKDAETFVKEFFQLIEEALDSEKYVKIKGLGTFRLIEVDNRESVNVNTGERFQIQGHTKVSFTPDTNLRETINKPFAHFETVTLNESTVLEDTPLEEINENESEEPIIISETEASELIEDELVSKTVESTEPKQIVEPERETPVPIIEEKICAQPPQENTAVFSEKEVMTTEYLIAKEAARKNMDTAIPVVIPPVEPEIERASFPEKEKASLSYLIALIVIVLLLCGGALVFIYYPDLFSPVSNKDVIEMPETIQPAEPTVLSEDSIDKEDTLTQINPAVQEKDLIEEAPKEQKQIKATEVIKSQETVQSSGPVNPDTVTYLITGTKTTYKIKEGETLTKVALRFYGTKATWPYIVEHNRDIIKNPDNVPYGTTIKIPELVKK